MTLPPEPTPPVYNPIVGSGARAYCFDDLSYGLAQAQQTLHHLRGMVEELQHHLDLLEAIRASSIDPEGGGADESDEAGD